MWNATKLGRKRANFMSNLSIIVKTGEEVSHFMVTKLEFGVSVKRKIVLMLKILINCLYI